MLSLCLFLTLISNCIFQTHAFYISELLTPSNSNPRTGASIIWSKDEVSTTIDNEWKVVMDSTDLWSFIISLDNIWAFDITKHSATKITMNSPSIAAGFNFNDILFGFTTDNQQYFTMSIPMDKNGESNFIYPACDVSANPTQTFVNGDIASLPVDNRRCDLAGGFCSNWRQMLPPNTQHNTFPIIITLENIPRKNALFVSLQSGSNTIQQCGFVPFPSNQGNEFIVSSFLIESSTNTNVITPSPTKSPSNNPTRAPSAFPTVSPTTSNPTLSPTKLPTSSPTKSPSKMPSKFPTNNPSMTPSKSPTKMPSKMPTLSPTNNPTLKPSLHPSVNPTSSPTKRPSQNPSPSPTFVPSISPTKNPSTNPTKFPTASPNAMPTLFPTHTPSDNPTLTPSLFPSVSPSKQPSASPSDNPSFAPSYTPSEDPTLFPTSMPTENPSFLPTNNPSNMPSEFPSLFPTVLPTENPSNEPTIEPTMEPTIQPTEDPTVGYTKTFKTTSENVNGDEIVTKDGDIRIFEAENDANIYSSTTFIGIAGMIVCFLCFGVLMFVHSKRRKDANEMERGASANMNDINQEMTLIHVGDVDENKRARLQSETIYEMDGMNQQQKSKKNTMTYSVQSSEDQQYLPINYDGNVDEETVPIAAVPEDDELSMSDSSNNVMIGANAHRKMSKLEEARRKRSRGSIVRSELKQLSKHMADVLHSNQ